MLNKYLISHQRTPIAELRNLILTIQYYNVMYINKMYQIYIFIPRGFYISFLQSHFNSIGR